MEEKNDQQINEDKQIREFRDSEKRDRAHRKAFRGVMKVIIWIVVIIVLIFLTLFLSAMIAGFNSINDMLRFIFSHY